MIQFWKGFVLHSIPVWLVFLLLIAVMIGSFLWFARYRKNAKATVDLSIVILSTPVPRWNIGAMAKVPFMGFTFHARLAHRADHSLVEIVEGYLEGTKPL